MFLAFSLQETIEIAINLILNQNVNVNITRRKLENLFLFVTSPTHFLFNGNHNNQIGDATVDSPLVSATFKCFLI